MTAVLRLNDVLTPAELDEVRTGLRAAPFQDGKLTAGPTARKVKANRQADNTDGQVRALAGLVRGRLERNDVFRAYARPVRWSQLIFSRYAPGDAYGVHVDDPVMASEEGGRLRTDLSFTMFLSEADSYEGGELLVDAGSGAHQVKLPAGGLLVYPSGSLHRVNPVAAGERLACVGWLQSLVRRNDQRDVLFDLSRVKGSVPGGDASLLVDKTVSNLMRMWAET